MCKTAAKYDYSVGLDPTSDGSELHACGAAVKNPRLANSVPVLDEASAVFG